jgi:NhaP-type Na+/H+ or K+/H+ antiporter
VEALSRPHYESSHLPGAINLPYEFVDDAEKVLPDKRAEIELMVALTVLLSALLHGVTAALLSAAQARQFAELAADAPEKKGAVEVPTREPGEVGENR